LLSIIIAVKTSTPITHTLSCDEEKARQLAKFTCTHSANWKHRHGVKPILTTTAAALKRNMSRDRSVDIAKC
jgi:hypothetical protein